ncbi:uncharacterized protein E0L32_010271 [Thyridium curvatum]|uniref:Uncharacterized protein n=1 Tax=Thyridium curvatum TaxID=1093900 RepID=A0A507AT34_9PEZI|nr:uncharacterized protein E0L32_010271 [Thyridium curvatum]TPX08071.1 hypothetical protein E0L32_010271 [Thyridium curvatum]
MAPRVLGRAFRPPGFYFEPGKSVHYRGNKELIFVSIAGPDRRDITVDELRERVAGRITQIFATCVEYKDLYVAVRGEELYWQTVAQKFNSDAGFSDLPWALLKELVEKYVKARKAYHSRPDAPATDLTEVVDRFIALHHETSNLPPSAGLLQLAVRTDPSDANAMSDSLPTAALPGSTADTTDLTPSEADLASVSTEPWPPGHFPSEDQVFLTHQYIRSLHGITPESRNAQDRKPGIPTGHSSPFQLRLILAYMALVNKGPEDTWCLYLLPIAFDDNRERQIWFRHSNRMSKQFQTTKAFLEYSQAMFASGREMTIAMLTPWFIDRPGLDAIGGAE